MSDDDNPIVGHKTFHDWLGQPQCNWISFGRVDGKRAWTCQSCGHNSLSKTCPLLARWSGRVPNVEGEASGDMLPGQGDAIASHAREILRTVQIQLQIVIARIDHLNEVRITARWMTMRAMGYSRAQIAGMGIE